MSRDFLRGWWVSIFLNGVISQRTNKSIFLISRASKKNALRPNHPKSPWHFRRGIGHTSSLSMAILVTV